MAAVFNSSMARLRTLRRRTVGLLLAAGVCSALEAANIYRYTDENGRTVFNSFIPPQYVKNGYTVLNERGEVIEVVPKAPTEAELAELQARQQAEEAEAEALRQQIEADNMLLRLYRSPDEVARKLEQRLGQLDAQLTTLQVSVEKLSEELAELNQRFEGIRQQGGELSAEQLAQLDVQQRELQRQQEQLQRQQQERDKLIADAERDMARLRELLNLPE